MFLSLYPDFMILLILDIFNTKLINTKQPPPRPPRKLNSKIQNVCDIDIERTPSPNLQYETKLMSASGSERFRSGRVLFEFISHIFSN